MRGPYDIGVRQNVAEVLGPNPWLWALPVFTSRGDGYTFPRNDTPDSALEVFVSGLDDDDYDSASDNDD